MPGIVLPGPRWVEEFAVDFSDAAVFPANIDIQAGGTVNDGVVVWDETTNIVNTAGANTATAASTSVDLISGTGIVIVNQDANGLFFQTPITSYMADYDPSDRLFMVVKHTTTVATSFDTFFGMSVGLNNDAATERILVGHNDTTAVERIVSNLLGTDLANNSQFANLSFASQRFIGLDIIAGRADLYYAADAANYPASTADMTYYDTVTTGHRASTDPTGTNPWGANVQFVFAFFEYAGDVTCTVEGWRILRQRRPS